MAELRLVLASASPRRRELLAAVGLNPTVTPSNLDESLVAVPDDPAGAAEFLAQEKARSVAASRPDAVVIGADTMVILDGVVLGKPVDTAEARRMLASLRDRQHQVITGVAVAHDQRTEITHALTRVMMRDFVDQEISDYIERGEPFDKAGAYAIQDPRFRPVAAWHGCYCNVVGLPLALTLSLVAEVAAGLAQTNQEFPKQCGHCPHLRSAAPRRA